MTQFYGKTKICYGPYALETLETFPASHAFVVTDPFMVKSGFADQAVSHLKRKGIAIRFFLAWSLTHLFRPLLKLRAFF